MEIKKTRDYKQFKSIKGNRGISPKHVEKLARAITRSNLLEANPIIVNSRMEIIDGQHRLEVARQSDLDIYYVVVDTADLMEIQLLNDNRRNWSIQNYIDSYITLGYKDYERLNEIATFYDVQTIHCAIMLEGQTGKRHSGETASRIRLGEFKIKPEAEEKTIEVLDLTLELEKKANFNLSRDAYAIWAVWSLISNKRNIKKLFEKIEESGAVLKVEANTKSFLRQIEDIYNFRQSKNLVRFV